LIIDVGYAAHTPPPSDNLEWSTYFGGSSYDIITNVAIGGSDNNIVAVGETFSAMFPTSPLSYIDQYIGGVDAFILDFKNNGNRVWSTYYGGDTTTAGLVGAADQAFDAVINDANRIYVVGSTQSADFPIRQVSGAYHKDHVGNGNYPDAFIVKLGPDGLPLWATYFGDDDAWDAAYTIATYNNNIYIAGDGVRVHTFPLLNPSGGAFFKDTLGSAFIASFNSADTLTWSTLFATGGVNDQINDIAVDNSGNIIVTGIVASSYIADFDYANLGSGYLDNSYNGGTWDAFISKFTSNDAIYWSTLIGGDSVDYGNSVITDNNGNIYLGGSTMSSPGSFPLLDMGGGALYDDTQSGSEAFIGKFSPGGSRLMVTYYGGDDDDYANQIDISNNGHLYVAGHTTSHNCDLYPLIGAYYQDTLGNPSGTDFSDAFILCLDDTLEPAWGTYFGGNSSISNLKEDIPTGIRLSGGDDFLVMVGYTNSDVIFPLYNPQNGAYFQDTITGIPSQPDGFISKFEIRTLLSVENLSSNFADFEIFPNPANEYFTISVFLNNLSDLNIKIYSDIGQEVYSSQSLNSFGKVIFSINSSKFIPGVYFVKLSSEYFTQTKPLIIY